MPWSEIAGRGRQHASKLIDRVTATDRPLDPQAVLREYGAELADPGFALHTVRHAAPCRFFAGVENPSAIADRLPAHRVDVLNSAEATLQSRFDLLGYRTLSFGEPIDWHLDPISSRRSPRVHWSHLNTLDPTTVGDTKVVWELSRHQWIVRLAQAHALTGNEGFADAAVSAIESWIDANPYGIGVNWASSLEVAYRVMSWSWILLLLRHSLALSGDRLVKILAAYCLHAHHVSRYLSHYFSPNTHLTGEALGLFVAGTVFPEFRDAHRWRDLGARILVDESRSQICEDGVHFERSTCYHRYTVETYQQFLLLAERNHVTVPAEVSDRLRRMVEVLVAMRLPDGSLPQIGDADGGRLVRLVERSQCDPSGVLAIAAVLFQRGDFAWAAAGLAADVCWLMGEEGTRGFDRLSPAVPSGPASRMFPSGGYAVMKTGWEREAHQMIVDVGPLGCSVSCAHGHADLLSLQCAAFGESCLVDAGTCCYTPDREWRNFFRGTAAHSTLMIDARDQAEPEGPFSWRGRPRVHLREWRTTTERDFVDAHHTAYPGVTHRRRVMFVKPDYWIVVDDVGGAGSHRLDLHFQFAPMDVSVVRDAWACARTPAGNRFWVGAFASSPLRAAVKTGELAPIRGWVSADYGQRTPAPLLVYSSNAPLPWRCITLLVPRRGDTSVQPIVAPLYDDQQLPIGLELEDRRESIFVDTDELFTTLEP
jgi:hypothetical protein